MGTDFPLGASDEGSRLRNLDLGLFVVTMLLGFLHAWASRHSMNPDGMSYLDVGDAFYNHDWVHAVNAWWSPLYPWIVGTVLGIFKPSIEWEFPVVHLVNLGIFLLTALAFRSLLYGFIEFAKAHDYEGAKPLPDWSFVVCGYAIFLWVALELQALHSVGPDMMVVACFCLSLSILIRLEMRPNLKAFALLGLILGIGYWTKAIMFPLGFVTLVVAWVWGRSSSAWTRGVALATLVFVCLSAPLVLAISRQKGRFTFGDSGKINYAWFVSPRTPPRNWQGEEPGSGPALHPTRRILKSPPVFEFDGPVVGTYPPWTDPSYWNEGLHQHFELKSQLRVLARTVPMELHVLLRKRPELVFGVVLLALLALPMWLAGIRDLWPFVFLPIAGMSFYLPLVENDRYLGGFVLVLFLAILRAVRIPQNIGPVVRLVVLTMVCLMFLSTIEHTIRILTGQFAEGQGPNSTLRDEIAARYLRGKMGTLPYTKVAIIGDGTDAYWAHLGKLRIVAEIMGGKGEAEFWDSPEEVRKSVYQAFRETGAKLIVMSLESCHPFKAEGWESIPGTQYYVRRLE